MNSEKPNTANNKCLFVINEGAPFKSVHEYIRQLNGIYNGVGWYVESKHKDAVSQICESVSLRCLEDFPFLEDSFEALKRGQLRIRIIKHAKRLRGQMTMVNIFHHSATHSS